MLKRECGRKQLTDWYVQWPNNFFKDLGSFLPSAPTSQVVAFSSSYLWPHGHIMVIPVRCHSCSSAVKMGRKESRSKGALLVSRSKKYHNFPIRHYVILGNMVSLGGKGARECEHVAKVTTVWIAMTGLDQRWMIHPPEMGTLLTPSKSRILLAREKWSESYLVDDSQSMSLYQVENMMGIEDPNHSNEKLKKKIIGLLWWCSG